MNSRPAYSQVAAAYAQAAGARATWLVRARNAFEVIAKTGMVGAHDRLVVYGDTALDRCLDVHPWQNVSVVDELTCDAFVQAGFMPHAEEAERARLVPEGSPASYAHPAGMAADRLFWLVPSVGGPQLRTADLRAFSRSAQEAGALLIVDNTLMTVYGCHPLMQGAHICIENLDAMVDAPLEESAVAVSVARSLARRGRRHLADPRAEDAHRLLSFGFGSPDAVKPQSAPAGEDLTAIDAALDSLAVRMQPRFDGANAIASYLSCHAAVGCVRYPALSTHPDHLLAPTVLEHGFGPAVSFCLRGAPAESMRAQTTRFAALFEEARGASAESFAAASTGESVVSDAPVSAFGKTCRTRIVPTADSKTCCLRLYMGTEHPLSIVDSLDQALRLFCNPPEP
ncbi:PLP-dependent transferase [Enorma massiliensis]|uniref:PLP-dependent transferase n=1 Tax=Enorma massiliensis TaxID=1472761 RepID=UPI003AF05190